MFVRLASICGEVVRLIPERKDPPEMPIDEKKQLEVYHWPGSASPVGESISLEIGGFISRRPITGDVDHMNRQAAEARAAILFGSSSVIDPLDKSQGSTSGLPLLGRERVTQPTAFRLNPSHFLEAAKRNPPKKSEATASAFSQWVYSIYGNSFGNNEDRERGRGLEKEIFDQRRKAVCSIDDDFLNSINSHWKLYYNGLHLKHDKGTQYFEIDHLRVDGDPLRASPDLIYKNDRESEIIIVEIKHSKLPITTNLWPNVWAQLWCYAQLDVARDAKQIAVIGEVWGEKWIKAKFHERNRAARHPLVCLRASVRRDPRAPAYDKFFRELFDIYRGKC